MKNSKLISHINVFYKLAQELNHSNEAEPMGRLYDTDLEVKVREIFKSWETGLDPSFNRENPKIEEVRVAEAVFYSRGRNALVPVCLVKQMEARPPYNMVEYEPSLVFAFGTFQENLYDTLESQQSYIRDVLLPKYAKGFSTLKYTVEIISKDNAQEEVSSNTRYQPSYYIAVFVIKDDAKDKAKAK